MSIGPDSEIFAQRAQQIYNEEFVVEVTETSRTDKLPAPVADLFFRNVASYLSYFLNGTGSFYGWPADMVLRNLFVVGVAAGIAWERIQREGPLLQAVAEALGPEVDQER